MVPVRGPLSHLDLNVSDPHRSIAFYSLLLEHLGYERHEISADRCWWSLRRGDGFQFGIEVRSPRNTAPRNHHERYSPGIDHLAFHAESRSDVDGVFTLLVEAGLSIADPPSEYDYSPGYYAVAFDDPNGIRLEVVYEPRANR